MYEAWKICQPKASLVLHNLHEISKKYKSTDRLVFAEGGKGGQDRGKS